MRILTVASACLAVCTATPSTADVNDVLKGLMILNEIQKYSQQQAAPTAPQQQTTAPKRQATAPKRQTTRSTEPSTQATDRNTVREIQSRLAGLGYDPGPVDGLMGRRTSDAIRRFEAESGLTVTGLPNIAVLIALRGSATQADSSAVGGVSPSFDCALAGSATEMAICASPDLAAADAEMASLFSKVRSELGSADEETLRNDQRSFLIKRDACGGNQNCLLDQMTARNTVLRDTLSLLGGRHADAASIEADTHRTAATEDLDRPLIFLTGQFVPREEARNLGQVQNREAALAEYAADPAVIENEDFLLRLIGLLPNEEIDAILARVYPAGLPDGLRNNIEAARRSPSAGGAIGFTLSAKNMMDEFDRYHFLKLAQASVEHRFPIETLPRERQVRIVCPVSLGEYDFDNQAFDTVSGNCDRGRLASMGSNASWRVEHEVPPAVVAMEPDAARQFREHLEGGRRALVSVDATLVVEDDNGKQRHMIRTEGLPLLHPADDLSTVLYRFERPAPVVQAAPDTTRPAAIDATQQELVRVPAAIFALALEPDLLNEEEWLRLTERQIEYDQMRTGPAVFSPAEVANRQPEFAAPELVNRYRTVVAEMLSALEPSAVIRLELLPDWLAYRNGRLTGGPDWGYIREIPPLDHPVALTLRAQTGSASVTGDQGLQQAFNVGALPDSLSGDLPRMLRSVYLGFDKIPRIPEIEMTPKEAEALFLRKNCQAEERALADLLSQSARPTDIIAARDMWVACGEIAGGLPENFVIEIGVGFEGAARSGDASILAGKIVGAELFDLSGARFAALSPDDFPSAPIPKPSVDAPTDTLSAEPMEAPDVPNVAEADILGLRLGMPLPEAERAVRDHYGETLAVLKRDGSPESAELFRDSLHLAGPSGETIALYYNDARPEAGLIGVTRILPLPGQRAREGEYRSLIGEKYGLPADELGAPESMIAVPASASRECLPRFPTNLTRGSAPSMTDEDWLEGSRDVVEPQTFQKILSMPSIPVLVERLSECAPSLQVKFHGTNDDLEIMTWLVDMKAAVAAASVEADTPAPAVTTKF